MEAPRVIIPAVSPRHRGKVAHVLRKYDPREWGGTETHVAEVTRRLGEHGFTSEVHAPRGPTTPDRALASEVRLVRYRSFLPFLGPPEHRRALIANAGNIATLDEPLRLALDREVALAHLHTGGRVGGAVRTAMKLTSRPYVVSVHGPLFANQAWLTADTERRQARVIDLGQPFGLLFGARRVLDDAARVITFNEKEREALAERIGARAIRMDHGVAAERLGAGSAERARARWPFLGDAPLVALVGRVAAQKNQVLAVHAFARGAPADHRLVLAGASTDLGYRERVEAAAREAGVAGRVHLLGNVDPTEVPDILAAARLLVVPSTFEAFGLAVLEGWAAGRPVLFAYNTGMIDIADALGHRESTIDSLEVDAWADRLRRFLGDEGLRRAATSAGADLVRRRYSWSAVVARLAALYEEVLDERRRR